MTEHIKFIDQVSSSSLSSSSSSSSCSSPPSSSFLWGPTAYASGSTSALLAYFTITRIGRSNFLHQFGASTPPKQRKLEL
jgi:hypothetical protein